MRRFWGYRFRRTTLLTVAYTSFLGGVGIASLGYLITLDWIWLLGALLIVFRRRTFATLLLVIIFGLGLGLWRGGLFTEKLAAYQPFYGQKIAINAQATEDAVYGKHSQITFAAKLQIM